MTLTFRAFGVKAGNEQADIATLLWGCRLMKKGMEDEGPEVWNSRALLVAGIEGTGLMQCSVDPEPFRELSGKKDADRQDTRLMSGRMLDKYRFALRRGNRFRLLVDGQRFIAAMLDSLRAARRYVLLEMYLVESGGSASLFIDALIEAARRGVRVCVLLDDFGCLGLLRRDRLRLLEGGVDLRYFNPLHIKRWHLNLFRNHRKLLLVDGVTAFTGGAGITDHFDPVFSTGVPWHETMVEIRGPVVADWQALFVETWNRGAYEPLVLPSPLWVSDRGGHQGRLVVQGFALGRSEVMRSFVRHIRGARTRVWFATAYFVPPWKLRRALRRSAQRGVDVCLLLPGPRSDHPGVRHLGRRFYERLLRDGVRIFEYQPSFLHAKMLLCDNWVSIGSSNMDRWTCRWNLEANQELSDPAVIRQVEELFLDDFRHCVEFDLETWMRRPWLSRWLEGFWGRIVRLVTWVTDRGTRPPDKD